MEEYKAILSLGDHHLMEFFTHNPTVTQIFKSVLQGLPSTTTISAIQQACSDLNISISHVRQVWRSSVSPDGVRSKTFLPSWVLTHSPDVKPALSGLTGLLHFRVRIEDLKSKDRVFQCFRCQEFGHTAGFCKFSARCNLCAGDHESRHCPTSSAHLRKCSNCNGDHPASSKDCPKRVSYAASLRRRIFPGTGSLPLDSHFPPLRPSRSPLPSSFSLSSFTDLLRFLTSPEAQEAVSLLASLLRTLGLSPQLITNFRLLLSAFSVP